MNLRSCRYCDKDIQWLPVKENNKKKWRAYDVDGTDHQRTCERTCVRKPYQVSAALPKQQKRKHVFKWGKILSGGKTERIWKCIEGKWVETGETVQKRYK